MNFWMLTNQHMTWLQALCKPKFIPSHAECLFICLNQQPGHLHSLWSQHWETAGSSSLLSLKSPSLLLSSSPAPTHSRCTTELSPVHEKQVSQELGRVGITEKPQHCHTALLQLLKSDKITEGCQWKATTQQLGSVLWGKSQLPHNNSDTTLFFPQSHMFSCKKAELHHHPDHLLKWVTWRVVPDKAEIQLKRRKKCNLPHVSWWPC